MKGKMIVSILMFVAVVVTGCDYLDADQILATFDNCVHIHQDESTGLCESWWDLLNMDRNEANATVRTAATATAQYQAMPTATATPIPPPVYRPINKLVELTPTAIVPYSPLPTPTATPFGGVYMPNVEDYQGILDWYFGE